MATRANQVKFAGLALLALAGTAGTFVFGILAGEGGKYHLLIILLGVLCASAPVVATAIGRQVTNRLLRTEVAARERAVEEREHALASKQVAERQTTEVQITRKRGSSSRSRPAVAGAVLPGQDRRGRAGVPVDPLIGSLIQAIVAAAVEHRQAVADRRSIFFADDNGVMRCVSYAGYEGQRDAARTTFTDTPDDPVGQQMFRLLAEQEARLIRDLADPGLPVKFPRHRSYQTIIAAAVTADQARYGVLTLDAPEADSLGQPDLEIMKTLANLLAVGLALAARIDQPALKVPAQGKREVMRSTELLPARVAH